MESKKDRISKNIKVIIPLEELMARQDLLRYFTQFKRTINIK